mgnify:CR=1 FL=1
MNIKNILDEIAAESSSNLKMDILKKYKNNPLLIEVIVKACSRRVKFYIKQIPDYPKVETELAMPLEAALTQLNVLSSRTVTGNDASFFLLSLLSSVNPDDAYVLERIIDKNLKIGMGTTQINKVIPNTIPKTPYMGAKAHSEKLVDKLFEGGTVVSDIKMDGRYCNAIVRSGEVDLESRQGETTHVGDAAFLKQLAILPIDCVLNGELTVLGMDRYEANGVIASVIDIEKKREIRTEAETEKKLATFVKKHGNFQDVLDRIVYTVWDTISVEEYFAKKSSEKYASRKLNLYSYIDTITTFFEGGERVHLIESKTVANKGEAIQHLKEALSRGLEGTVLKSADGTWKDGKPNWQVKMKLEITLDLKIVGFNYGTKGTKNENVISTLQTETSCGLLKTNPSGMDEAMMEYVTENQEDLLGTIVEIRCCGLSTDSDGNWSTLHPSVVKLRDDKNTCDSLKSAQEIENMSKTLS